MADFLTAYNIVHGNEGGYANTPGDKGGETYMGIARVSHPTWAGWPIIDAVKQTRAIKWNEIIKDAVLATHVQNFYKASWNRMQGPALKNQAVANLLYDFTTNSGGAGKVFQRVLVNTFQQALVIDGAIGPATAAAANAVDQVKLHNALKAARIAYLTDVVAKIGDNAQFLPGWLRRVNSFPDLEKKTSV
jgi:lysozyme family protein